MSLKKIKTEKYITLVSPPLIGLDYVEKIIKNLAEYCIFKNIKQPEIENPCLSVIEGNT